MKENYDIHETVELCCGQDVQFYIKSGWVLLEVKDRAWNKMDMDDDSCPVIFIMGRVKKDDHFS